MNEKEALTASSEEQGQSPVCYQHDLLRGALADLERRTEELINQLIAGGVLCDNEVVQGERNIPEAHCPLAEQIRSRTDHVLYIHSRIDTTIVRLGV